MGKMPLVSAIIPVYNCERYLAEAIESALAQSYQPVEIIVVDDGSTDGSAGVASQFGSLVRCIHQPHSGCGAARNRGAAVARGSFVAFLDSDDLWQEGKIASQVAAFEADPDLDVAFGLVAQFVSPELDDRVKEKLRCLTEPMPARFSGTMLIRADSFRRVGPFETEWQLGEFIDWYSKAMELELKSLILPQVVLKRRLHTSNLGIRQRRSQIDYVRILKASLDRRRKMERTDES